MFDLYLIDLSLVWSSGGFRLGFWSLKWRKITMQNEVLFLLVCNMKLSAIAAYEIMVLGYASM